MATDSSERHPCASCAEPIKAGARLCPQCGAAQSEGWTGARILKGVGALVSVLTLMFALQRVYGAWDDYATRQRSVAESVASARTLFEKGAHEAAWELLEAAQLVDSTSAEVRTAQIEVAADWLMSGFRPGGHWGQEGPAAICQRIHPQLVIASVLAEGEERAALDALIAWSNLSRGQVGMTARRDLGAEFRAAVAHSPESFYANLLLGYWQATNGADPFAAIESWDRALATGHDEELVRNVAVRALSGYRGAREPEVRLKRRAFLIVLDSMRENGEAYPQELGLQEYMWLYGDWMAGEEDFEEVLPVITLERHLALFDWVEGALLESLRRPTNRYKHTSLLYIQARLLEEAGRPEDVLAVVQRADVKAATSRMQPFFDALYERLSDEPPPDLYERKPWLLHVHRLAREAPDSAGYQESLAALLDVAAEPESTWQFDPDVKDRIHDSIDAAVVSLDAWKSRPEIDLAEQKKLTETVLVLRYFRGRLYLSYDDFESGVRELEALALLDLSAEDRAFVLFSLAEAYAYSNRAPSEVYDEHDWNIRAAYLYEGLDRLEAALESGYSDWDEIESRLERLRELPEYARVSMRHGRVPPRDGEEG
jgi:hypothetical protein